MKWMWLYKQYIAVMNSNNIYMYIKIYYNPISFHISKLTAAKAEATTYIHTHTHKIYKKMFYRKKIVWFMKISIDVFYC